MLVSYRSGDMWAPRLDATEALQTEVLHFIDCISNNKQPETDGHAGLRLLRIVEAAEKSLRARGELVEIGKQAVVEPRAEVHLHPSSPEGVVAASGVMGTKPQ
jgi:hypothetical protein